MRAIRVRVADVLDDGHLARIEFGLERCQAWVQAEMIVQLDDLPGAEAEGRARLEIEIVAKRDDGVQAVVPAAQLDDDEDVRIRLRAGRARGPGDKRRDVRAGRDEAEAFEAGCKEFTPGLEEGVHGMF